MEVLRDIIWLPLRVTSKDVIADVANRHRISVEDLLGAFGNHKMAPIRHEAMWEVRRRTKLSLPQIAGKFRLKDHTTVLYGIRRHEARLAAQKAAA